MGYGVWGMRIWKMGCKNWLDPKGTQLAYQRADGTRDDDPGARGARPRRAARLPPFQKPQQKQAAAEKAGNLGRRRRRGADFTAPDCIANFSAPRGAGVA